MRGRSISPPRGARQTELSQTSEGCTVAPNILKREIRQFEAEELVALLDYFVENWPVVTLAPTLTKTFLWSWGRRSEVVSLKWQQIRLVGNEVHFKTIGKRGVEKWFRIPNTVHQEL